MFPRHTESRVPNTAKSKRLIFAGACVLGISIACAGVADSQKSPGESSTGPANVSLITNLEPSWYEGAFDPICGTDRYKHVRTPHNNVVDTVYQRALCHGNAGYGGVVDFTCDASGIADPHYSWSCTGSGAVESGDPSSQSNVDEVVLDFGHSWPADQVETTVETVRVTGSDGVAATDTYTIRWHAPVEKWVWASGHEIDPIPMGSSKYETLGSTTHFPTTWSDDYRAKPSATRKVFGMTGGTGDSFVADEVASSALAGPIFVAFACATSPYEPTASETIGDGTPAQFLEDVAMQEKIDHHAPGALYPKIPRMSSALADAVTHSKTPNEFLGPGFSVMYKVGAYQAQFHRVFNGDGYNSAGYYGTARGYVNAGGGGLMLYHWRLASEVNPRPHH